MRYNLGNKGEAVKAFEYLTSLVGKDSLVDIKRVSPSRSLRQNAYLYVTFGIFGLATGFDTDESKNIYKRYANPRLYVYKKRGVPFLKSSTDLTVEEMTISIERWREYAAEHGVDIPPPTDNEALMYWQNEIERSKYYLK